MINALEGLPRSGKSYEAVVHHILEALKNGRKVITNLPVFVELFIAIDPSFSELIELRTKTQPILGTWDADRTPAFELFEPGERPAPRGDLVIGSNGQPTIRKRSPMFGQVWDYYSPWKDKKGRGPLFVIDECHIAMPRIGADSQVVEWYRLHGHFNQDVLLITQSFREMDQAIAGLIAILIRVRKADIMGDPNSYIRKVHAGYRGAVISTDIRKYQKQFFALYKSHTQGNSVAESSASDVKPFIVKFNRFKWLWLAGTAVYGVYAFWPASKPSTRPKSPSSLSSPSSLNGQASRSSNLTPQAIENSDVSDSPKASKPDDQDPFRDQKIHLTGWFTMGGKTHYSFVVSSAGQRLFELTQYQIAKAGYTFQPLGDCAGILTYADKVKTVICDAPRLNNGNQNAPVVISDGSGKRSDDGLKPAI